MNRFIFKVNRDIPDGRGLSKAADEYIQLFRIIRGQIFRTSNADILQVLLDCIELIAHFLPLILHQINSIDAENSLSNVEQAQDEDRLIDSAELAVVDVNDACSEVCSKGGIHEVDCILHE